MELELQEYMDGIEDLPSDSERLQSSLVGLH